VSGFTKVLNNLDSVARSSPRKSESFPSPPLAGTHVSLFGNLFRQIIPLSIWYTPTLGTILSLQSPSFYTPGVFGLHPHTVSNHIARAEEAVLGASFNAQSQAPDIPGFLLHDVSSRYTTSLDLDFHLVSFRVYMEELSVSFNTQDQAPDSYVQARRCVSFHIPCKGSHVLTRLLTKQEILHLFLRLVSQDSTQELFRLTIASYFGVLWIEFQLCCLWIRFVTQGVVCFLIVGFGGHTLISQYDPRFFVDNLRKDIQVLARLHTKQVISHFFLQLVSQDSAQELFRHTIVPYRGVSRIEFEFCFLWTPFVSQGVVCLHRVGCGGSWTFTVIYLNVSRGSTLFVSLYISFA
jgi:hypothetical protein